MITLILMLYIKKHKQEALKAYRTALKYLYIYTRALLLLLCIILCAKKLHPQTVNYQFEVKKSNHCIGNMTLTHIREGASSSFIMVSEIKYRFILLFQANAKETANFQDGILMHSTLYREQTGSKTISQQIKKADTDYIVINDGKIEKRSNLSSINYNILCMYHTEPVNAREVFIDKIQQKVPIKKIDEHHYRIELPDGNYNDYFYANGNCKLIKVHQGFFDIEIVLKSIKPS